MKAAASGMMPLEFILGIMRDEQQSMNRRIDAAKVAIGYCHPRLNSVHQTTSSTHKTWDDWVYELIADLEADQGNSAAQLEFGGDRQCAIGA